MFEVGNFILCLRCGTSCYDPNDIENINWVGVTCSTVSNSCPANITSEGVTFLVIFLFFLISHVPNVHKILSSDWTRLCHFPSLKTVASIYTIELLDCFFTNWKTVMVETIVCLMHLDARNTKCNVMIKTVFLILPWILLKMSLQTKYDFLFRLNIILPQYLEWVQYAVN